MTATVEARPSAMRPTGPSSPRRSHRRSGSPERKVGWWLTWMFGGVGIWWATGLIGFIQLIVGLPLMLWLVVRRRLAVPKGFAIWLVFLGFVVLSLTQVSGSSRYLSYAWRTGLYVSSTMFFLYVYNASRHQLPARRVINGLAVFFAVTVLGGFIGMLTPAFGFASPLELILPRSITSNEFIKALVHPSTTAPRAFAGTSVHRPKAPFPYTNQWGAAYAISLPFAIAAYRAARTTIARNLLLGLLIVSTVPLVVSLDRGAWLSTALAMGYAVLRLAQGRRKKAAFAFAGLIGLLVLVVAVSPLGDLVSLRLDNGYGDDKRALLYTSSIDVVKASPLLGEGTPVPLEDRPDSPSVGTHGQLWTLLVSHGVPATAAFCGFVGWMFLVTARRRRLPPDREIDIRFWCNVALLAGIVQLPFYELLPWGLPMLMCAGAVAWREQSNVRRPATTVIARRRAGTARRSTVAQLDREPSWYAPGDGPAPTPWQARLAAATSSANVVRQRSRPLVADTPAAPESSAVARGRPVHGTELTHLARQGTLSLVGTAVAAVFGFAYVVVLGRGFGAGGAGLLLESIAAFTILANIVLLGADTGLVRMVPQLVAQGRRQELRRMIKAAFWPPLLASVVAAVGMWAFAPQLADLFIRHDRDAESAVHVLRILAPALPLVTLTALSLAGSRAFGSLVPYVAIHNIALPLSRPVLTVGVIMLGLGTTAVAWAWSIPLAGAAVLGTLALLQAMARSGRRAASEPPAEPPGAHGSVGREFWAFTAPRGLTGVLAVSLLWFDVLLVGAILSTREAGVYAAASRYIVGGTFALQALGVATGPQISRLLAERRRDDAASVYQAATTWLIAISWPGYLTMAAFAPVLMGLFGSEFKSGATSLTILSLALLVLMATGNNKIVLLMGGKSTWNLVITSITLTVNVVIDLILIPRIGINGAAIGWAASTVVDNVLTTYVLHRLLGLDPFGRAYPIVVGWSLLCFGGVGLAIRLLLGASVATLVLHLVIATPIFAFIVWRNRTTFQLHSFRTLLRPGATR